MSTVEFWDRQHTLQQPTPPRDDDPILRAAHAYFGDVAGKRLLDIGCGLGTLSLFFADRGARVVSIDSSAVAISKLRDYCAGHRLQNLEPLHLAAAEIASLGDFDCIIGSMILHHIEPFDAFARSLRQVLPLGGKAFFYENSAASSLLIWFRQNIVGRLGVPKYGDASEFPLTPQEIDVLARHFSVRVSHPEMVFFRLVSPYLLRGRCARPFEWLDSALFRVPQLRQYSYRQYLYLEPR